MKTREERERAQFLANRKGKGTKRVGIQRTFAPREDGKCVRGAGIVIRPKTFGRDSYRALIHFAKRNGITLVKLEVIPAEDRGVAHETVITWLAIGTPSALRDLANHDYVGAGNWNFATDAQVLGFSKMAPEPKTEREPAYPHPHEKALLDAGIKPAK